MTNIEKALVELALAQRRVTEINKLIGEALSASRAAAEKTWETSASGISIEPNEWFGSAKNGWLALAYQIEREHYGSGEFDTYYANHDGDVEGFLAEKCQHALRAHQLVQQRKSLRKALGIAKRRVTFMANRLADKAEKGSEA
jgi:hypothetical protein